MVNKNKIDIIKHLINSVNLENINYSIIRHNIGYLYNTFKKIKGHWKNYNNEHIILNKDCELYKTTMQIMKNSLLADYSYINKEFEKINQIVKLSDLNITFYYLNLGKYETDVKIINELFLQSVCLAKYSNLYGIKKDIIIIWLPIDKKRDYIYENINEENLKLSIEGFNAFTASGVTYGKNPRITIISRYEEIKKLLIHELIHNFNLDGSGYHEHNNSLIKIYKKIKNPATASKMNNYDYCYSIYESYTELLSSYLSIIFRNINLDKKEEILERIETEILLELFYSYNTIANLIKLNDYKTFEDFELEKKFKGEICVYEYYYLKGLMYNNYKLELCDCKKKFQDNYLNIININKTDELLKDIFQNMKKQTNFAYVFYD
jgi:hypothetical protein